MSVIPAQSQQRPRPKSTWSFVSNKSGGSRKSSSGSTTKTPKVDLKERSRDKRKTRFGLSQDPTRAISEDEPCEYPPWCLKTDGLCERFVLVERLLMEL